MFHVYLRDWSIADLSQQIVEDFGTFDDETEAYQAAAEGAAKNGHFHNILDDGTVPGTTLCYNIDEE